MGRGRHCGGREESRPFGRGRGKRADNGTDWNTTCRAIEIRLGYGLERIDDPADLWDCNIAYVSRGAIGLADMKLLSVDQYLHVLKTIEAVTA